MRNPYEVLGVPQGASPEQINAAYKELMRRYQESGNSYAMNELNEAYDAIMNGTAGSYRSSSGGSINDYTQVRELMRRGALDSAEQVLENMPQNVRDAQWYYLKGQINYKRGWTDQAYTYFSMAYKMDPSNAEYRHAYENMNMQRSGGFRTSQSRNSHRSGDNCDGCDICQGLICADCCCECMGGDFIRCC